MKILKIFNTLLLSNILNVKLYIKPVSALKKDEYTQNKVIKTAIPMIHDSTKSTD